MKESYRDPTTEGKGKESPEEGRADLGVMFSMDRPQDHRLPMLCQELFYRYYLDLGNETFESFYKSTFQIFLSFAMERCAAVKADLDPHEIVNRLYGILVAHASSRRSMPMKALLSWCFGVIGNIIKEELRHHLRQTRFSGEIEKGMRGQNPLDLMILKEDLKTRDVLYQNVLKLITTRNTFLSDRERKIMNMFYCEGLPLRQIASLVKISTEHAAVILYRSRRRIFKALQTKLVSSHLNVF